MFELVQSDLRLRSVVAALVMDTIDLLLIDRPYAALLIWLPGRILVSICYTHVVPSGTRSLASWQPRNGWMFEYPAAGCIVSGLAAMKERNDASVDG